MTLVMEERGRRIAGIVSSLPPNERFITWTRRGGDELAIVEVDGKAGYRMIVIWNQSDIDSLLGGER